MLKIKSLTVEYYPKKDKIIRAVDDVSVEIACSETVSVIGESGCGKTTLALSILRLIQKNEGRIIDGEIVYNLSENKTINLLALSEKEMYEIRGKEISIIFQDPFMSLNPVFTIGNQLEEVLTAHSQNNKSSKRERQEKIINTLKNVHIPSPEKIINYYPHQLSGGMLQRVMIAMALLGGPKILICDEPTTALDVETQEEIINLLHELKTQMSLSILFITHNIGIVTNTDKLAVMYAGTIVEEGLTKDIIAEPLHPYTVGLWAALPWLGKKGKKMSYIPGYPPEMNTKFAGCRFYPRCEKKLPICEKETPPLITINNTRRLRCFLYV
jgi:peptide/nickel transport system ATP-binding protein